MRWKLFYNDSKWNFVALKNEEKFACNSVSVENEAKPKLKHKNL